MRHQKNKIITITVTIIVKYQNKEGKVIFPGVTDTIQGDSRGISRGKTIPGGCQGFPGVQGVAGHPENVYTKCSSDKISIKLF